MKASNRVGLIKPSAIRKMLELSAKMKDVVHLEQGEPNFTTPGHILDAAMRAMKKGLTHYTEISGTLQLRQAIADKLLKDNKIEANPQTEVTVTSGSQEAMLDAAQAFLNPGDEALVIDPYYPAYYEDTLLAGAVPVTIELSAEKGYRIQSEALDKKITDKTRMIWVCNPSNPTGNVFKKQDLEAIAEAAQHHDLLVFVDEIYEKLVYDGTKPTSLASLPGMEERTITVNGFSKAYAMTGWRIGYVAAEKELSKALRTMHYYTSLCPNTISQEAALAALTGPQDCVKLMVDEYRRRRELVLSELHKLKQVLSRTPDGAFYAFPDFSFIEKSDEVFAIQLLEKAGVVTVPGSGFGKSGEGHLRISYSYEYGQVEEGMRRIRLYLESQG